MMIFYKCQKCDNIYYSYRKELKLKCCNVNVKVYKVDQSIDNHNLKVKVFGNYLVIENKNLRNDIHFLNYIIIHTNYGYYYKNINNIEVFNHFLLQNEEIINIYYSCNIHDVKKLNLKLMENNNLKNNEEDKQKE